MQTMYDFPSHCGVDGYSVIRWGYILRNGMERIGRSIKCGTEVFKNNNWFCTKNRLKLNMI